MKPCKIYFLNWNGNKAFIADYPKKSKLLESLENDSFQGYFGTSPGTEEMQEFQSLGKVRIDMAVRAWFNESRFLLHFILATGIFLLSFYFLSYVIKDPLPMVDEIIISSVLGILGWYRLNNQELQSEKALLKKQDMIQSFNRIPFNKSDFLEQAELYLEKVAAMKDEEIGQMLKEGATPLFFNTFSEETYDFRLALENFLSGKKRFPLPPRKQNRMEISEVSEGELKILLKQLNGYVINR